MKDCEPHCMNVCDIGLYNYMTTLYHFEV